MLLKIDYIKQGKSGQGKHGPWQGMSLKSGEEWYSYFAKDWNSTWKIGDTIDAVVEQNGQYKNIKGLASPAGTAAISPSAPAPQSNYDINQFASTLQVMQSKLDEIIKLVTQLQKAPGEPGNWEEEPPF